MPEEVLNSVSQLIDEIKEKNDYDIYFETHFLVS